VDVEFVVHEGEPRGVNFADMTVRDDAGAFNSFVTVVGGGQLDNTVQPGGLTTHGAPPPAVADRIPALSPASRTVRAVSRSWPCWRSG
jgi:hypothetical protein